MAEEDKKDAEEELPAEEREELEQLFSMMDKNGDGELSSDELYEALTELGVNGGEVSREHVEAMMKAGDADGNGQIDKEEFVQAIAKLRSGSGYDVMPVQRGSLGTRKASVGMMAMLSSWWSSGAEASENEKRHQEELAKKQKKAEKLAQLKAEKSKAAAEKMSRKLMQQRVQARQQGGMTSLARELTDTQEADLKETFALIDKDGSGGIDAEELHEAMKHLGFDITLAQAQTMVEEADEDDNGEIDFEEFRAMFTKNGLGDELKSKKSKKVQQASMWSQWRQRLGTSGAASTRTSKTRLSTSLLLLHDSSEKLSAEQRAHFAQVFEQMDANGDGDLEPHELQKGLRDLGVEITLEEATEMVELADADGNGSIDKDEFIAMMAKQTMLKGNSQWQLWWRKGWLSSAKQNIKSRRQSQGAPSSKPTYGAAAESVSKSPQKSASPSYGSASRTVSAPKSGKKGRKNIQQSSSSVGEAFSMLPDTAEDDELDQEAHQMQSPVTPTHSKPNRSPLSANPRKVSPSADSLHSPSPTGSLRTLQFEA